MNPRKQSVVPVAAVVILLLMMSGAAHADLVMVSGNPYVPAGARMYEDRTLPYDGLPPVFWSEYGAAPKTAFDATDFVYFAMALDWAKLEQTDFFYEQRGGVTDYYLPRMTFELWRPGADTAGAATWKYLYESTYWTWDRVQATRGSSPTYMVVYTSRWVDYPGDVWTRGGGFAPGDWAFRIAVEVHHSWVTALAGGTFSAPWDDPAQAPVSGVATAVPEPASLLLLSCGVAALGVRRVIKKRR